MTQRARVAVVVGHREHAQGAVAVDGVTEWQWHQPLAQQIVTLLDSREIAAGVFLRPSEPSRSKAAEARCLKGLVANLDFWAPDFRLLLHFNGHKDPSVNGTEALYLRDGTPADLWAGDLAAIVARTQGTRLRHGDGDIATDDFYALRENRAGHTVLLETHFGSNARDHELATAARDSGATARAVADYLRRQVLP